MEYWTEEKLRIERAIERVTIDSINRQIQTMNDLLLKHKDRLEYLMSISNNQTKIDFDENDTNQY